MNRKLKGIAIAWLAGFLLARAAIAESVSLQIGDISDPTSVPRAETSDSLKPSQPGAWLVYGRLSMTGFSVTDINQVRLQDGEGRFLPLIVESNTLYREFGEIAGMRIAFEFDPRALSGGLPLLSWGADIAASNRFVPDLTFTPAADPIRQFTVQSAAPEGEAPRFATIAIIADSKADRYYLWYLLPMVMIFGLLVARKLWTR